MSLQVQKSFATREGTGTLYLVGTPIGNLEDMTFRAVRTLKEADLIAAEDTRQTRKLLTHFDISKRLVSYHEHNKQASGPELVRLLQEGQSIALVSDAGLPAISDPGADLVALAVAGQIPVVPIPGANAALSALIVSGLPTDQFIFLGFPPRDKKPLGQWLEHHKRQEGTLILYESPHRLRKTLEAMLDVWGERRIAMVRELTKRHEEIARGFLSDCLARMDEHQPIGEYVLIVEGAAAGSGSADESGPWWAELDLEAHVSYYEATCDRKEAIKKAAADRGIPKRDVYNEVNR